MNHLIAIVGPTGIGKSRLALHLAQKFNGEIINADSRQLYRHMDIGTAKPTREELSLVPHHLIDIVDPAEDFSLAQYQHLAYEAVNDVLQRGKLPFLVGGSGLYVWSVLEGWSTPKVPPDQELRDSLESIAASEGADKLYRRLQEIDPDAARQIDPRNVRRVIRAIEVYEHTKTPISKLQYKKAPPYRTLVIGLTTDRAELYRMIDERVDRMLEQGLVAEVQKLIKMGYDVNLPAMSGIGYRQIAMYLKGELALQTATEQIKFENHRFVRQQYTWFRLNDGKISWFNVEEDTEPKIAALVANFIKDNS